MIAHLSELARINVLARPRAAEPLDAVGIDDGYGCVDIEVLRSLPEGMESELAERGANLSQGERQLVSLARALAYDPEILILDEATSSVDPHSERLIQAGIKRLLAGRTAIIIAHRLSTVLDADRILVLHRGRLVEAGTHAELIDRNGYYARLYRIQFA